MITREALLAAGFKEYPVPAINLIATALFCKIVKCDANCSDDHDCQDFQIEVYEYDNRDIGGKIGFEANVQLRMSLSTLETPSIFNVKLLTPGSVTDIERFYSYIYSCI